MPSAAVIVHPRDISPAEFRSNLHLYSEAETVTITVGSGKATKSFTLPIGIATHLCTVFKKAFTGQFINATTRTFEIPDNSPEIFDMIVQWMYTGKTSLGPQEAARTSVGSKPAPESGQVKRAVEFFILADMLDLQGDFTFLLKELHQLLRLANRLPIIAMHLHDVFTALPRRHKLRKLFALATVADFVRMNRQAADSSAVRNGVVPFRFEKEMEELEGFALELLGVIGEMNFLSGINGLKVDPFSNTYIYPY